MDKLMYEGNGEVLICTADEEAQMVKDYFVAGGRDLEEYDITRCNGVITMTSEVRTWADAEVY